MINVKDAILSAKRFAADALETTDLLLEEVSSTDDTFSVTLSLPRRTGMAKGLTPSIADFMDIRRAHLAEREFKQFEIRKDNGEVTAMSIRELSQTV